MSWTDRAACAGMPLAVFFGDVQPVQPDGTEGQINQGGLAVARAVCARCPVRVECLQESMEQEEPRPSVRSGVRAGLTGAQRRSVWRRDVVQCSRCGDRYDPLGIIAGDLVCSCGEFQEPPIPDVGDCWYPRHDALLVRLRDWVLRETGPGDKVPPPSRMLVLLGHRRKDDLYLVYQRLVDDGLLVPGGRGVYHRQESKAAWASWQPPHRRVTSGRNNTTSSGYGTRGAGSGTACRT